MQLIKIDGTTTEVEPQNGKKFSLDELRGYVGGTIDTVRLPKSGKYMIVNDNGKLDGLPKNERATEIWKKEFPISEYPHNNDELIVGDVLMGSLQE